MWSTATDMHQRCRFDVIESFPYIWPVWTIYRLIFMLMWAFLFMSGLKLEQLGCRLWASQTKDSSVLAPCHMLGKITTTQLLKRSQLGVHQDLLQDQFLFFSCVFRKTCMCAGFCHRTSVLEMFHEFLSLVSSKYNSSSYTYFQKIFNIRLTLLYFSSLKLWNPQCEMNGI